MTLNWGGRGGFALPDFTNEIEMYLFFRDHYKEYPVWMMQHNINTTADENNETKNRTWIPDTYHGIPLEALQKPRMHQACQRTPVHT